jgi:ribonuclease HI
VHPPSGIGYGASLVVADPTAHPDTLKSYVQLKRFEQTSSTQLEVQTLIWALREIQSRTHAVTIHTDSQNLIGLPGRRERFEQQDYRSKNNLRLNHAELYQAFFSLTDQFDCTFVKVKGHQTSTQKSPIDRLFTLVDRAARQALRTDPHCI